VGFVSFRQLTGGASPQVDRGAPVLRADESRAWLDAEALLERARADAAAIVGAAQDTYDEERRRGYREGFEQARMEEAERAIDAVSRTVDYLAGVESEIVELVLGAVKKIFADFDDGERVLIVARGALSVLRQQKQMTLRAAPSQAAGLKERMDELLADYPNVGHLDVVPDARLSGDACILESGIGSVEASIDGQIEALRRSLERFLGARR
jgi:type III secretion protein L